MTTFIITHLEDVDGNYWAPILIQAKKNNVNFVEQREDGITKFNSKERFFSKIDI